MVLGSSPRRLRSLANTLLFGLAPLLLASPVLLTSPVLAQEPEPKTAATATAQGAAAPWSAAEKTILEDVRAGRPLVTRVFVPLCSNKQINCGAAWAGSPAGLKTNIYWGAQYGARRFFEREDSMWERVELTSGDAKPVLENAVYRRWVPGERWGLPAGKRVEQLVVLTAIL